MSASKEYRSSLDGPGAAINDELRPVRSLKSEIPARACDAKVERALVDLGGGTNPRSGRVGCARLAGLCQQAIRRSTVKGRIPFSGADWCARKERRTRARH